MLLAAIGVQVQCTVRVQRRQPIHRAAFSAAAVVIAVQAAGWGWRALGGSLTELNMADTVLSLAVVTITYFAVNTGFVAAAVAVTTHAPARSLTPTFLSTAPSFVVSGIVAALVGWPRCTACICYSRSSRRRYDGGPVRVPSTPQVS